MDCAVTIPVKICGITRLEDAELAVELGARALGFIFYPPSPRYVEPAQAASIIRALPPWVTTVGVFVKAGVPTMNRIAQECALDRLQLHGDEPPELMAQLARPAYRAFRMQAASDVDAVLATRDAVLLLDTHVPDYGGSGRAFDWAWARRVVEGLAGQQRRVILSGGLNPDNVVQAITQVHPFGLDVSSGVEVRPGRKDPARLRALFAAVAAAVEPPSQVSSHAQAT